MYVFAVPLLNISVKHDLKGNVRQLYLFNLYVTDLTRVLSAVRKIYRWGIFSVEFSLLYCKDTELDAAIKLRKELDYWPNWSGFLNFKYLPPAE